MVANASRKATTRAEKIRTRKKNVGTKRKAKTRISLIHKNE
jgi:hypothetical protein